MPDDNWSEQYRLQAVEWVELDMAANLLEELKSATLAQQMTLLGDIPVSHAERTVKASSAWTEYVTKMVEARKLANLAKVKTEFLRMKHQEQQSSEATARAERRM